MQYFVPPFDGSRQTTYSLRASHYQKLHTSGRKRKRHEDDDEPPSSPDDDTDAGATSNTQSPSARASVASLSAAETAQLRVAGLLPDDNFQAPKNPFPHAPLPSRLPGSKTTAAHVQRELAALEPPLYAAAAAKATQRVDGIGQQDTLRQTHIGNLTTMLHRCLLEGDYERAGRAWGMLLRSHARGRPIDVRHNGRWAIGAEIHLQRNRISRQSQPDAHVEDSASIQSHTDQLPASIEEDLFSEEGFRQARHYYDLLILQYPARKMHAHAVNQGHFYPAMFSLWIYEASQQSKIAKERLRSAPRSSTSHSKGSDDSDMDDSEYKDDAYVHINKPFNGHVSSEERRIIAVELKRARAIAERLDQLLGAPPFDKRPDLLQLRDMVALWIGDLLCQDAPGPDPMNEDGMESNSISDHSDMHETFTNSASRFEERQLTADSKSDEDDVQDPRRATENSALIWKDIRRLGNYADR
ncbi:uncharacterized protein BDZ99DRAFT_109683 [Mytilinidion resinicola]|uniref:Uncharacterized protein n=1 Tax=Mytilinidion resinicola TaxID=574789 RepID=A0A6A6YCD4_9PEZI|nr:uncharacterized protein BDZ99DRAFT_109683 [Mytilinidion resinicola]KAF2805684.1 hypothetical protein BDZ99DRAFT_109683 [Mytilinidion resinicola]